MIEYKKGNIANLPKGSIILHGVNNQNAMGSGVAKDLSDKYPKVKKLYHQEFINNKPSLGRAQPVNCGEVLIFNLWTQENYGFNGERYASADAITKALENAMLLLAPFKGSMRGNSSKINIPKLGCGRGGLDWDSEVLPIVEQISKKYNIDFIVWEMPDEYC